MADIARELLERALQLDPFERLKLAQDLLESVDEDAPIGELSPTWRAEICRRAEEALAGQGAPDVDWREALEQIRSGGASAE